MLRLVTRAIRPRLILAGILVASAAGAQERPTGLLQGTVLEAEGGARTPIPGATVQVVELRRTDVTHDDGTFSFGAVTAGRYTLRVTRIGFAPSSRVVTVAPGSEERITFSMSPAAVQLEATVSTGTVGTRTTAQTLSPTSVVGGADLDRQLAASLAATLQNTPGVSVATLGPATARPVIRGLSGDRVVVLEDGARTGDMSSTGSDHALAVDPLTVRQFEVVRGPMSLLYGSSALGGVVNAIREDVPATRFEHTTGTLNLEGSSVDRGASVGGFVAGSMAGLTVRGEGTFRRTGDQRTPLGTLDNTYIRSQSGGVGASRVGDDGFAGGAYRYYTNSYGVPGGFIGGHEEGVRIDMRRHQVKAEGERRFGSGFFESVKSTAQYTNYRHEEREASGTIGTRYNQQVVGLDVLARHGEAESAHSGAVGARYQFRDIGTGGTLRTPSTYDNSAALFLVEEWVVQRLRLQGGVRYDWSRYVPYEKNSGILVNDRIIPTDPRTFGSFSGSVGSLYELDGGVRLGASVSRAYRTPDFNELYSNGPHLAANSYDVGNPELGEESGIGADVFIRLTRARANGEVALFHNRMSGYIYPRNTGDLGLQGGRPKFQFTGRDAKLYGGEGSLEVNVVRHLVVEGMVSLVRGEFIGFVDSLPADTANGQLEPRAGSRNLPLMPPLNGRVGVRYEDSRFFGGAGLRLASEQDRLGDYETPTDGYGIVDASIGVRLLRGAGFHAITLRLDNITNQEYRNHLSRTKDVMPEAGRNVSLLYRMTF